jgi:hypothetical protein
MRSKPILLIAPLLLVSAGFAQSTSPASLALASPVQFHILPKTDMRSCPVGLDVRFSGGVLLRNTGPAPTPRWGTHTQPAGPGIEVDLTNRQAKEVVSIDAHVQGISNGVARLVPLSSTPNSPETPGKPGSGKASASRASSPPAPVPFHTDRRLPAHSQISLEWALKDATGVDWVQVDRIRFADGSSRQRPHADTCKARPNPNCADSGYISPIDLPIDLLGSFCREASRNAPLRGLRFQPAGRKALKRREPGCVKIWSATCRYFCNRLRFLPGRA